MNIKNIIIIGLVGAIIALAGLGIGLLVGGNQSVQSVKSLGGITNYDSLTLGEDLIVGGTTSITGATTFTGAIGAGVVVTDTFTQGGGVRATSTIGTVVPLLASDFDTENMIDVTLNVQDATLSFPASSTLTSFIPNTGDSRKLFVRNASTTAAMDITVSGGTGVLLKVASTTGDGTNAIITGDTDGANFGIIQLIRKANTDIEAFLNVYKD